MDYEKLYNSKKCTVQDCLSLIESGDVIVTEYGAAYMRGRTIRERAQNLIAIAHPDFREELTAEARKYGLI